MSEYTEYGSALSSGKRRLEAGLTADTVGYDADTDKVVIAMAGGWDIRIERGRIEELSDSTPNELSELSLSPAGTTIELPSHDVYISLEGLLTTLVPSEVLARLFARRGGRSVSAVKAESSRLNGLKGGRPKKEVAKA
jgi:hypothetical protein